jgi:hypothetical protein
MTEYDASIPARRVSKPPKMKRSSGVLGSLEVYLPCGDGKIRTYHDFLNDYTEGGLSRGGWQIVLMREDLRPET